MKLSTEGKKFLIDREGMKLHAYKDVAGLLTIGVGHLLTKSELQSGKIYISGIPFQYSNGLTVDQVMSILAQDVRRIEEAININIYSPINQNQFDALVSFVFNVGTQAFINSTLLKRLNQGNYAAVAKQFLRWKYSGGHVIQGLVNRREKEAELWNRA
jgi:lysozyme